MATTDAANFVRNRLLELDTKISQEEMQSLVEDLHDAMGHAITPREAAEVIDLFAELKAMSEVDGSTSH